MPENKNHKEYDKYKIYWKRINILYSGLDDVQTLLLDLVPPSRLTCENMRFINAQYKQGACYTNFVDKTVSGLIGSAFRAPQNVELPSKMEYIINNFGGQSLEQVSQSVLEHVILHGRVFVYVDYVDGVAKTVVYDAMSAVDWKHNDQRELVYLRVEITDRHTYEFALIDGIFTIVENDAGEETITTPKTASGKNFKYLPIELITSRPEPTRVDKPPILPVADLTRSHYQNSADHELTLRNMTPTPWMNATDKTWMEEMYPDGVIPFGSGNMIVVPGVVKQGYYKQTARKCT